MFGKITKIKDSTKETVIQVTGLKTRFAMFDFIATLKISVTIFKVLAPATSWLQEVMINFVPGTKIIYNEIKKL